MIFELLLFSVALASNDRVVQADELQIRSDNKINYVQFTAPNGLTSNKFFVVPPADGSAGQCLVTDGSGNLSFSLPSIPGAPNYFAGFDSSGVLTNIPGWTWDNTTHGVTSGTIFDSATGSATVNYFQALDNPTAGNGNYVTGYQMETYCGSDAAGFDCGNSGGGGGGMTGLAVSAHADQKSNFGDFQTLALQSRIGDGVNSITGNSYSIITPGLDIRTGVTLNNLATMQLNLSAPSGSHIGDTSFIRDNSGFDDLTQGYSGFETRTTINQIAGNYYGHVDNPSVTEAHLDVRGFIAEGVYGIVDGNQYGFQFSPRITTAKQNVTVLSDFANITTQGSSGGGYREFDFGPSATTLNGYTVLSSHLNATTITSDVDLWEDGTVIVNANAHIHEINLHSHITNLANDFSGFSEGAHIENQASGGYNGLQISPQLDVMSASGYVNEIDIGGQFSTGHAFSASYNGINIHPSVASTGSPSTNGINGINVDLSQAHGTSLNVGMNINNGSLQASNLLDTALVTLPPGSVYGIHNIGGTLQVSAGFPITAGQFGFGTNLAQNLVYQDDVGPDFTGLGLGFSVVGYVGQLSVLAGKTVSDVNMAAAGVGMPATVGDGGTVTNFTLFRALGALPEGGTSKADNIYGFRGDVVLCAIASGAGGCWGDYIADTTADNWFSKDVVIGGTVKKPTGGAALDVTGLTRLNDGHLKSTQTTAPVATVNSNAGTGATCALSNATDLAGTITLTSTAIAPSAGTECAVAFNAAYGVAPICSLSPQNDNAALYSVAQGIYQTTTTSEIDVVFANSDVTGRTYKWSYHCIETQ